MGGARGKKKSRDNLHAPLQHGIVFELLFILEVANWKYRGVEVTKKHQFISLLLFEFLIDGYSEVEYISPHRAHLTVSIS